MMNPSDIPTPADTQDEVLGPASLDSVLSHEVIGLTPEPTTSTQKAKNTLGIWTTVAGILVLLFVALIGFIFVKTSENAKIDQPSSESFNRIGVEELNLGQLGQLDVNGVLRVNGGVVVAPSSEPTNPTTGQLYLAEDSNQILYYDGSDFQVLSTTENSITSFGGSTGSITLGEGLDLQNNVLSVEGLNTTPTTPTGLTITGNSDGIVQRVSTTLTAGLANRNSNLLFTGTLSVANGGTGANNASTARTNLGAAASGANSDITSLSGLTTALSVFQGGTGVSNLAMNGVLIGGGSGPVSSLVAGSSGLCLISTSGTPSWSACSGGGTVASVNTFTGAITIQGTSNQVNINNSSGTITLSLPQNIHTAASPQFSGLTLSGLSDGIVQSSSGALSASAIDRNSATLFSNNLSVLNGGTGANNASTARTNLGAAASGANSDITSLSGLTTPLSVAQGGTSVATLAQNGVLIGNGTGAITSVVAGGTGLCLTSTVGAPSWASCPGSGGVSSVNTFTGAITIQGTANQVNINNSSGTITLSLPQDLNTTSSPQFSGLTLTNNLTVQGGSATLGTAAQAGGLIIYDGSSNTGTLQTAALGQNTVYTLPDPGMASVSLCLTSGNCAGVGGGVTTAGGTNGAIALFTSSNNIEESIITQSGSTLTAAGNLVLQGANSLSVGTASTNAGSIAFYNTAGGNTVSLQAPNANPSSNLLFRLPSADGNANECLKTDSSGNLSFGACLSGSGGGSGGVISLDGLSGTLNVSNATGSGNTITIDDATNAAKGIASFDATDFTVSSGAVSIANDAITSAKIDDGTITGTDIANATIGNSNLANSSVTVSAGTGLSGGGAVALGASISLDVDYGSSTGTAVQGDTILTCPSGSGNLTGGGTNITLGLGGSCGGITTVNNPTFTTSVTSAQLILTGAGSNGTLQVANLGQPTTYTLPDPGAASATICLSTGNCAGSGTGVTTAGGSTNTLAKFTGSQAIGDSTITDNGTTVTIGAALNVTGAVTLTTPLAVTEGGTGANNASTARTNLGAAASGANSDITSLSGLTTALSVGQGGTGATTLTANGVLFGNGSGAIQATAAGSTGQCLVATTGNAPTWGSCAGSGSGATLQAAYDNSTGSTTPEIKLDSTRGGLDIQDANSSISGSLLTVRASNAGGLGAALFDVNSTGQIVFKNSTNSTSAFQIQNANASRTLFSVDTNNNRVGIGTASPGAAFEISDGTDSTRFGLLANGGVNIHTTNSSSDISINPARDLLLGTALTDSVTIGRTDQNNLTTINGSVLSKSQTDSATAFQIQNAAGEATFTVGTDDSSYAYAILGGAGYSASELDFNQGSSTIWAIGSDDSSIAGTDGFWISNVAAGQDVFGLFSDGGALFRNNSNSTSALRVQNAAGTTDVLNVDTTNARVGIGTNSPQTALQLATQNARISFGDYTDTTNENVFVGEYGITDSDVLQLQGNDGINITVGDNADVIVASLSDVGAATFRNQTDSTTAFQIQNAAGSSNLLIADTTNTRIGIGKAPTLGTLDVNGNIYASSNISTNASFYSNSAVSKFIANNTAQTSGFFGKLYVVGTGGVSNNDVVVLDSSGQVITSTTARDQRVVGVVNATVSAGNNVEVALIGTTSVNATTNAGANPIAIGDQLVVSTTAGMVMVDNNATTGVIGRALSALASGTGTVNVALNVRAGQSTPTFRNQTDSATAFQIQNAAGDAQFLVNTSTGAITIGDADATGTITLGQSTATNIISVGSSAGGSATQTINIGTSSTASSTTNINIGSTIAGTTAITGPTTITNRTSGSTASLIVSNSTSTGSIAEFRDNSTNVFTLADGGAATFRNQTDSTTAFNIQNAAGTTLLSANTSSLNVTVNGDLKISKRADVSGGWSKVSQSTAGTIADDGGSTASIDGVGASIVYNGSLYVGTDEAGAAEVYRYDGGSNWTKVSQATAGTIAEDGGSTTAIAKVWGMAVYNGNLYIGTQKTSAAEVYRYDGGSNWTKVSQATAGTIASGGTSGISTAQTMTVFHGNLYVGTFDSGGAEIYRYDGGTTWVRVSNAVGQIDSGGTSSIQDVYAFANYNGQLYAAVAGSGTGNIAEVYRYEGGTDWTKVTPAGVTDQIISGGTSGIDKVRTINTYNGALYIGTTKDGGGAEVYRYDGGTTWVRVSQSTAGQIASGDTTGIISVEAAQVYNGRFYVGTRKTTSGGSAEIYRYDGGTTWTKVSQSTAGTLAPSGTAAIDVIDSMIVFNNKIYVGTNKTDQGEVYYYEAIEGESYSLTFGAASDETATEQSNFLNEGSIKFLAENQAGSVESWNNTGAFEFSHGITTAFGAYDVAEDYPTRDDDILPGTVVSIDPDEIGFVARTNKKQDSTVLGVYSEKPGLRLSQKESHIEGARAIPVALAGRVPVLVTNENGPILPGDYLTSSSTPGYAMKATEAGPTIGKTLEGFNGETGKVMTFINISYYSPNATQVLHNQEIQTGALDVQGSALISGDLNVSGDVTISNLTVTSGVVVQGHLTVTGSILTKNLMVSGHITTGGATPAIQVAGGIVLGTNTQGPEVSVQGNDTAGQIIIDTSSLTSAIAPGDLVSLSFASSRSTMPRVFIDPVNAEAADVDIYKQTNVDYVLLKVLKPLESGKVYKFDYFIVE